MWLTWYRRKITFKSSLVKHPFYKNTHCNKLDSVDLAKVPVLLLNIVKE